MDIDMFEKNECAESLIFRNQVKPFLYGGRWCISLVVHYPELGAPCAYGRVVVPREDWNKDSWQPNRLPDSSYDNRIVMDLTGQQWVITPKAVSINGPVAVSPAIAPSPAPVTGAPAQLSLF